jgi:hypothetical protein
VIWESGKVGKWESGKAPIGKKTKQYTSTSETYTRTWEDIIKMNIKENDFEGQD